MSVINIFINGEAREIPGEIDLNRLLELFSLPHKRIAVELNGTVIRRHEWLTTVVSDQDRVEVVHFVGGG